ncbi:hypothetical protein GYA49_04445 [Candidatus Beckwithbacteria bacterium]|nr:hypothetical protein [Candidatus Beckwithbacteria bacterium]
MANIIVFGDSIAHGYWDLHGGWVARLRKDLDKQNTKANCDEQYSLYNLSIPGDNSSNILDRFNHEIKRRVWGDKLTLIFAFGINDSVYIRKQKKHRVGQRQFKENLQKIIKLARKYTLKIYFVGLTPVNQKLVDPMLWSPNESYIEKDVEKYEQTLKEFCQENELQFIELMKAFKKQDYEKLLFDGVHPNSKGHELIYEIIYKHLAKQSILNL